MASGKHQRGAAGAAPLLVDFRASKPARPPAHGRSRRPISARCRRRCPAGWHPRSLQEKLDHPPVGVAVAGGEHQSDCQSGDAVHIAYPASPIYPPAAVKPSQQAPPSMNACQLASATTRRQVSKLCRRVAVAAPSSPFVATTPSERHHRNMASTWTTELLKQLVAWNGKVTAGAYAVVISEASLRSTEKLPSEGATGHDAA